jgi:hypothetical protein
MHLVANISLFDIACQFTTAECGDAAALQLAAALRADAEAVINPDVTPEELKRVSQVGPDRYCPPLEPNSS